MTFGAFLVSLSFNTAVFQFERHQFNKQEEITKGEVFFDKNKGTSLFIKEPVNQQIYLSANKCDVYYPDENKLLSLDSPSSFSLSFIEHFLHQGFKDFGLVEKGFKVDKMEKIDGLIHIKWLHSENNNITCNMVKEGRNKILSLDMSTPTGRVNLLFKNHLKLDNKFFPRIIEITDEFEGTTRKESVYFSEIILNKEISPEKFNLVIPPNTVVEEIRVK